MLRIHRLAALAAALVLLAACSDKQPTSNDAPLAFAPADTPYAYANLEPVPVAVTDQWSRPMQDYWPTLSTMYQTMLDQAKADMDEHTRKIVDALFDEIKSHGDWNKLRAIGLKPDARVAMYGIGIVPVLRIELGDPAAFRVEVARVEQAAGAKLQVMKTGNQEYWQVGNDALAAAIAIEGTHLVVTMLPPKAGDALKQTLLGVTRPAQNLAAAGTLEALAKKNGFSPYGAGYVDFVRLVDRLGKPLEGSDAEFARALGLPVTAIDETCRREYAQIAQRFPRLTIGAQEMSAQRMTIQTRMEIASDLATAFAGAIGAAPGSGDSKLGVFDFSLSTPVLKLKDFWLAQAAAVAAKPYQCANLVPANEWFAQSATKVDVSVPPPFSDLTGVRMTIDSFEMAQAGAIPKVASKLLIATGNPLAALTMAQLAMPALQKIKVTTDGKPVSVPTEALPPSVPAISVAMSPKAIALATGDGEAAMLADFLAAPPAANAMFLRMHFSGAIYGWMARSFETLQAALPAEGRQNLEQQRKLFGLYEKWLRATQFTLTAEPNGIVMRQTIELNAP